MNITKPVTQQPGASHDEVVIEVLESRHIDGATACIAATFAKGEPMSQLLGISLDEFTHFARLFIEKTAREGLSVVAVNSQGEVIGVTVAEDYASEPPAAIDTVSAKFEPIFALLEALGDRYMDHHEVAPGTHYHIFMCGVYQEYANRRLAQKLNLFAENIAREKGYQATVCEATGRISQFVCAQQLGMEFVDEIYYKTFQLAGEPVFADITVDSCVVFQKLL